MTDHVRGTSRPDTEPPELLEPLRVLVVEDDPEVRANLLATLARPNLSLSLAMDGGEALRRAADVSPHVVVMDLGLPTMDGWQAITRIRSAPGGGAPYIIVLSGFADARSRELAFEAGCNEYVVKPCDIRGVLWAFLHRRPRLRVSRE